MSVQTEIDRISQNVANTYATLEALGCDMPDEQTSDNLAPTAGTSKVVLYNKQTLTDAQKEQARDNIGATRIYVGSGDMPEDCDVQIDPNGEASDVADTYAREQIQALSEEIDNLVGTAIPNYYKDYLAEKIDTIKSLMDEAGNNGIAFITFSDSHASDENGGYSGSLARKIMDDCHIDKSFYLGDAMSSSIQTSEANAVASLQYFNDMVKPIIGKLKQARGNHDGAWGTSGDVTYAFNLTDEQVFNRIGQKNRLGKPCIFGDGGFYFYMNEDSTKTRYIVLNTHDRPYELNDDGTVKYNGMNASIRQAQFDWLADALNVEDGWSVICFCHVPPVATYADSVPSLAMLDNFLATYRDKTTYSDSYTGQYGDDSGVVTGGYTNLFDTSASGFDNQTSKFYTNWLPYNGNDNDGNGTIYHIKGLTDNSTNPYKMNFATDANGSNATTQFYCTAANRQAKVTADYDNSVVLVQHQTAEYTYCRFEIREALPENLIITANEDIVEATDGETETTGNWDAINIDVDFSAYKGEFISLFTGHMHNDYHYDETNSSCLINVHTIASDGRIANNSYMTDATYENRALGTIYEQCLDVVIVNKATKQVNTVRIGAGRDRVFTY